MMKMSTFTEAIGVLCLMAFLPVVRMSDLWLKLKRNNGAAK